MRKGALVSRHCWGDWGSFVRGSLSSCVECASELSHWRLGSRSIYPLSPVPQWLRGTPKGMSRFYPHPAERPPVTWERTERWVPPQCQVSGAGTVHHSGSETRWAQGMQCGHPRNLRGIGVALEHLDLSRLAPFV